MRSHNHGQWVAALPLGRIEACRFNLLAECIGNILTRSLGLWMVVQKTLHVSLDVDGQVPPIGIRDSVSDIDC